MNIFRLDIDSMMVIIQFSHYPTTTMVFGKSSQGFKFKDMAERMSVYFCGHLHRLYFGKVDAIYFQDDTTVEADLFLTKKCLQRLGRCFTVI